MNHQHPPERAGHPKWGNLALRTPPDWRVVVDRRGFWSCLVQILSWQAWLDFSPVYLPAYKSLWRNLWEVPEEPSKGTRGLAGLVTFRPFWPSTGRLGRIPTLVGSQPIRGSGGTFERVQRNLWKGWRTGRLGKPYATLTRHWQGWQASGCGCS